MEEVEEEEETLIRRNISVDVEEVEIDVVKKLRPREFIRLR